MKPTPGENFYRAMTLAIPVSCILWALIGYGLLWLFA